MRFKTFFEEEESKFLPTVKKQLGVPKVMWLGMPFLVSNTKLGKHKITEPTTFYVTDFSDDYVTLSNVPKPGYGQNANGPEDIDDDDPDDEIDMSRGTISGRSEITITRKDFEALQEPQMPPQSSGVM